MLKSQKINFVKDLTSSLSGASCVVLVEYQGLNVKAQGELRRALREVGAQMTVAKNTLVKLAGEAAKLSKEALSDEVLSGPTAIIVTKDDAIAPLQVLGKFAQEHNLPKMKVGIVEGLFQDGETLIKLSNLPGKEILSAQVVGALMAPSSNLVGTLNASLQKLVYVLKEASKKGGE